MVYLLQPQTIVALAAYPTTVEVEGGKFGGYRRSVLRQAKPV